MGVRALELIDELHSLTDVTCYEKGHVAVLRMVNFLPVLV
jgi:hypothetical protein